MLQRHPDTVILPYPDTVILPYGAPYGASGAGREHEAHPNPKRFRQDL